MFLKEINSDYYGKMYYRLAGIVDIKKISKDPNIDLGDWLKKYHPRKFFLTYSMQDIEDSKNTIEGFESFVVYIPLEQDNLGWEPAPENGYYKHWIASKRTRNLGLVIAKKEKELIKWQKSAPHILTPDYYFTSSNFEELKNNFDKEHGYK